MSRIRDEENILSKLLHREEILWAQKSRVNWLKWGDKHRKKFHQSTIERRSKNKISSLKDSNEVWVSGDDQIKSLSKNFFSNLFESSKLSDNSISKISERCYVILFEQSKEMLSNPLSRDEIKRATFDLRKLKAPRPDGFQAGFYQNYWDLVGNEILDVVEEFFNSHLSLKHINQTLITLIPKVKNHEVIS